MNPTLEAKKISSQIKKSGTALLKSVSLSLFPQDKLVLTGESGSGKTLLLKTLVLLEPISEGEVFFEGRKLESTQMPAYRSRVIYLSQKSSFVEGSVEENLTWSFHLKTHQKRTYSKPLVLDYLKRFNLNESFLSLHAKQLSGGEGQIVALIRALILNPKVLLLDEPTASLDINRAQIFERLILDWIGANPDRSFIWVTHQKEQEQRLGNKVLTLSEGSLI